MTKVCVVYVALSAQEPLPLPWCGHIRDILNPEACGRWRGNVFIKCVTQTVLVCFTAVAARRIVADGGGITAPSRRGAGGVFTRNEREAP